MAFTFKHFLAAVALSLVSGVGLAAEHVVEMKNSGADGSMVFEPGFIKAEPGDTVKFVLVDQAHNSASVEVPEGAQGWQGAMNKEFTVTLDAEGVYVYKCTPHAALNMAGIIQVGDAVNYDRAKAAVEKLSAAAAINKERLSGYFEQVK